MNGVLSASTSEKSRFRHLLPASDDHFFYQCTALTRVTFAEGSCLRLIGNEAFCGCQSMAYVEIPATVEKIGDHCFCDCFSLDRVTLTGNNSLRLIGEETFSGYTKLTYRYMKIGDRSFSNCSYRMFQNINTLKNVEQTAVPGPANPSQPIRPILLETPGYLNLSICDLCTRRTLSDDVRDVTYGDQ